MPGHFGFILWRRNPKTFAPPGQIAAKNGCREKGIKTFGGCFGKEPFDPSLHFAQIPCWKKTWVGEYRAGYFDDSFGKTPRVASGS